MKLKPKISLPIIFSGIVLLTIMILIIRYFIISAINENTDKLIDAEVTSLSQIQDDLSTKALFAASILSKLGIVNQAYEEYYRTGNIDSSSQLLGPRLRMITESIKLNTGLTPRIHFHLPPARSFFRSWSEKKGDDISGFRKTILYVFKTHKSVKGIETGRGGFVIRGIVPILSADSSYMGSVEVFFDINEVLNYIGLLRDEEFAIFINKDLLNIATKFLEDDASNILLDNVTIGDYVLVGNTKGFVIDDILLEDLELGDKGIFNKGDTKFAITPISNFAGKKEGIGILQVDLSFFMNNLRRITYVFLGITIILIALIIALLILLINIQIINRIENVDSGLKKLARGMKAEDIEVRHNDEIGELETSLIVLSEAISKNVQFAIETGKWNFDTDYKLLSRDDTLGIALLQMRDNLQENLHQLEKKSKELLEMNIKLEKADKLKSAFLANISHEIRTPMNGIVGFSNLMCDRNITHIERKDYFSIVQSSCTQLLSIIDDLVDISKIEAGMVELYETITNLNKLVRDFYDFYSPSAKDKNIEMHYKCGLDNDNAFVMIDNTKLNQILTNLIDNALKFTEGGQIDFGYVIKGQFIEFWVEDTGFGISEDDLEIIFERFRQADSNSDYKLYRGTGLGLSICKAFIELMGGNIWVESEVELGSIFYFTIPYKPVTDDNQSLSDDFSETDNQKDNWKGKKILVVEDEATNYLFLEVLLKKTGASVLHAVTGKEAVDISMANPDIDVVLMDIQLPEMDGYEATRRIKSVRPDLPIITQTGYALSGDERKAFDAGTDEYISKPIITKKLLRLMRKYLS
jgi:signal transduction histidine kinase/CheY-like chemotaxis protein